MPRISSSREHRRRSSCNGSLNHRRREALRQTSFGSRSPMCTDHSSMGSSSTQSSWESLGNYLFTKMSLSSNHNNAERTSNDDQDSFSRPPSLINSETSVQTTSSESSPPPTLTALDRYYARQRSALPHHLLCQGSSLPHQLLGGNQTSQNNYLNGTSSMPQHPVSCFSSLPGTGTSFLPQPQYEEESWGQFVDDIEPEEVPSFNYRRYQAILNRSGRAYYYR